jgi:hypothetical protein
MSEQLRLLDEHRRKLFATTAVGGRWEVYYSGYDSGMDRCLAHQIWDNGIDDDGIRMLSAGGGYRLNTPEPGLLTVDRSFPDPLGREKGLGSVLSRRDEVLRPEDGFTGEARLQLHAPSGEDAVQLYYRDARGWCFGLHLSPDKVRGGGYGTRSGVVQERAFDTTSAFHTYRMVVQPNATRWSLYIDGKFVFEAEATPYRVTSLHIEDKHPTVIVGGEKGSKTTHLTLDYVGYRRGAYAPGVAMPPALPRFPHPLPAPLPRERWQSWRDATVQRFPTHAPEPALPFVFQSAKPAYNTYAATLAPAVNKGDYTVEFALTVDKACEPRGFSGYVRDLMGTWGILWSPDKVELTVGAKHVGWYKDVAIGIRRVMMNTTDRAHKYRVVRPAGSMYCHLYIDDNPVPALYDQHLDASCSDKFLGVPTPALVWGDTLNNWGKGHVTIHDIRWTDTAYAPAR